MTDEQAIEIAADELSHLRGFPRGRSRPMALAECGKIFCDLCATMDQARELARHYARGARALPDRTPNDRWGGAESFSRFVAVALDQKTPEQEAIGDFYGFPVPWAEIRSGLDLSKFEQRVEADVAHRITQLSTAERRDLEEETHRYIEHRLRLFRSHCQTGRRNPDDQRVLEQPIARAMVQVYLFRHANRITPGRCKTPWNES